MKLEAEAGAVERYDRVSNEQLPDLVASWPGEKQVALEAGRNSFAVGDQLRALAEVLNCDPVTVRKQLAGEPKTDRRETLVIP